MAVTARLVSKFHDVLGEEASNDMVDWMNHVEASRSELRELNDQNFARFKAELAEQIGSIRRELAEQIGTTRQELGTTRQELGTTRQELGTTRQEIGTLRYEIAETRRVLEIKIEQRYADGLKWNLLFWVTAVLTVLGLRA
jgi:septal ring factor EnvC (AmiA/AmiB activator)